MKTQRHTNIVKKYVQGSETKIVELLNLVFGDWGNIEHWRYKYPQYPTFTKEDVVVAENKGEIVGHGGLHVRDFTVKNEDTVITALLGDAAVHPNYRKKGIYSKIVNARLESAKSRKVSLAFSWFLKGSISYKACKKRGFVEVQRYFYYIKMLKPEKILKTYLKDGFCKKPKLENAFQKIGMDIRFCTGNAEVDLEELLEKPIEKKGTVWIIISEKALLQLIYFSFRRRNRLYKFGNWLFLVLSGKVKVRSSSITTFVKLIINGISFVRALI